MINDYSEVTCTLQRQTSRLEELCAQGKDGDAKKLAMTIAANMVDLMRFLDERKKK